jgi:hypothetical protein
LNPLRHSKLALKDDFFPRYSGWKNTWDFDADADADADANSETLIKLLKVATVVILRQGRRLDTTSAGDYITGDAQNWLALLLPEDACPICCRLVTCGGFKN